MNYNGNMPDWHQYNPSQAGISDVTSTAQNVNSGHLSFVSNINSNCPTQLNNLNLGSDGLEKHQNDPNFNPRHFQHLSANISHGHNATDNAPLASMVQMQNCIGHYGPSNTRNPIVDNLNGPMDPRNTAMSGLNEELNYRGNQMPLNGPISHLNGSNVISMNAPHGSIGPRNTVNSSSHATNRTGHPPPSFVSCKGMCCNPDSNYQQWEKYCSYQNNVAYRENVRTNGYQADVRRFGGDFNFRKDNFDGKEVLPSPMVPSNAPNASDHRRNFPDFKYRKERALSRSYSSNAGMLQSYPMQNYSYTGDYQKYSYPSIKEYSKVNNMNVPPNQAIMKHQDQNFVHQQKYNNNNNNNKSIPYQNTGSMMSSGMPPTNHISNPNMISPAQNTYFNSQYPRNLSTDTSHDCQHSDNCQITNDNATMMNVRMQTSSMHASSHAQYQQVYQQKIAMQRFSMENHLREMTRIPGYQSHPKYKECVLRYREILKLQSVTYQGQIPLQQTPSCVATTTVNTAVPPINLQFDQNGVLINSNYMPEGFPRIQQVLNSQASDNSADKQNKQDSGNTSEIMNRNVQKQDQLVSQQHDNQTTVLCSKDMQQQDRYSAQKNLDQSQFEVQKTDNENFSDLNANASDATVQPKISKEFADKPELDVRQFLANWDESEDEDGTNTNLPNADSTPVVVVGYENVNLSTKTLEEVSKPQEITTNVITFENQDKNNTSVIPAQDCLTISYASTDNVEIMKNSTCKEIAKENIIQPGSHIIQCISNGPNEVPTIHIVDNLEIGSILQVTNGQVTETLSRQDTVSFFQDNTKVQAITIETDKKKIDSKNESIAKYNTNLEDLSKEKYIVENASHEIERGTSQTPQRNDQETVTLPISVKNNLDTAQEMNLKKQNSFASEESHNPDDISLPDLPTSECTPISTTLNTPIHSDSEESSERVQDLTISTNPIEVMQNSPMISFTQSPTKSEPYDHLSNEEETVKNKSRHSLESQYQTENHFKDQNNMLDHDAVLDTFEFSTNIDKNESTENSTLNKERTSLTEDAVSTNNGRKAFSLDSETERAEATDVCMTLASDEYELKIMSAQNVGTPNKSMRKYKNSSIERCMNESQVVAGQDASTANQKLQALSETSIRSTLRYNDSTQLDEALQNIADKSNSVEHQNGQVDINYEKKCTLAHLNQTTNAISASMNDVTPISPKIVEEDNCPTKVVKSNPSMFDAKHPTINSDKLRKCQTSDKSIREDSSLEKNANDNKSLKIDTRDLKSSWHIKVTDKKKSCDQAKKCLSENTEDLNKSDILRNKPRIIDNVSIDDSTERMRLLKKYRRIKLSNKSSNIEEIQTKGKDTSQEACDFAVSKICHSSSDPEQSALQIPSDKQLCQKDARFKLVKEQEKKHANILKTFVTKNVNPDFAIQVTNVNLKLKDEEQKESQHSGEETKNSGSLDAIKIEINVSCTERNTTEKLLHENIKNAVAETIGHLTSSISSGTRANSANITEIQCDKRTICDKDGLDCRNYEKHNRSPPSTETSVYSEVCKDQNNTEVVKYKSLITACKEDTMMDETSGLFVSRKRKSSLEQELINDVYKDNGNINIVTETALSSMETLKEHAIVRKSVHQDTERKAVNFNGNNELKTSSDNSLYTGSIARNITVQKKENQETSVASVCRNVRNLQDDIMSRLNAIPSTSSSTVDPNLENGNYNNSTYFDYNHFDVAPNENFNINEKRTDKWKRSKKNDKFSNFDLYEAASGYVNPIFFSANELENLNTVPVYTTKDGKITYSPNPRFTYRELIMEARTKDNYNNTRESSCFAISPPLDYNCSKLRKIFKRNRDIALTSKKKEIDSSDGKLQSSAKHINYLANKNAAHKSAHCAKPHLEFFNNDADKLYANRNNQQDGKESNKKNIVDLSFLEKQYNLDNESASSTVKHCKMKIFTDTPDYKKGYGENSMFDSNLFLGSKVACWEETMESVKSYSSHIDRRNNDNLKELNFTEVFAAQRRLDIFLSTEQNSLNNKNNQKTNCDIANELTLNRAICVNIDNLHQDQNTNDPSYKQTDVISLSDQNKCNKRNDNSKTEVDDYPLAINEYPKQESQSDEIQSGTIALVEKMQSRSPKAANKNTHNTENQSSTNNINDQEMLIEHFSENDTHVQYTKEIKSDAENTSEKQISNLNSTKFMTLPESNIENLSDEPEHAETTKESVSALNEKTDKIDDFVKNNSDSAVDEITICQQVLSASANCKANEEIMFVTESITDITAKVDLNKTNEENDVRDEENSTTGKKEEPIILQSLSNVVISEQPQLDEESSEQLQKLVNEENTIEASKNQINDEVDDDNPAMTSKPIASLDLPTISTETSVCDLFANEKRDQNISEFTVIKSIIAGDKKEHQKEPETKDDLKDCDNIIDSKLLCMDSSDCGIYTEDRCTLTRLSEHGFTEEDSIVPMEWETSQIQEDAVNRLCNIDESSINFVGAANSLQDGSFLDNLSLPTFLKKSSTPEIAVEIKNKSNISMPAIELEPELENSKITPSNEKDKEQASSKKYEKTAYLCATDCNANTKIVPKLVIKKSNIDNTICKSLLKPGCQPKIPKMIIRNARSRPGTPSIESVHEEISVQINISDRMSLTSEELYENDSESSLQESNVHRNKIPKMKIKLDDKHSNKIIRAEDTTELCAKRRNIKKTIPKVKIKNSSRIDNPIYDTTSQEFRKNLGKYEEKIPILKLRKQERNRSSSPEMSRKRQSSSSHSEISNKKFKKSGRDETMGHSTRLSNFSNSTRTIGSECETKKNPLVCISEKIPKVIIKRTSASAEFKCELSKGCKDIIAKSAKWQPAVQLERYQALDSMVKDLTSTRSSISLRNIDKIFAKRKDNHHQGRTDDHKLSRSYSMSNLLPIKQKQRRMSDYDCRKSDTDDFICVLPQESNDGKICSTPKKISASCKSYQSDNRHRSRSRDNNSQAEMDIASSDKKINRSFGKTNSKKVSTSQYDAQNDEHRINSDTNHKQIVKKDEDETVSGKLDQKNIPKHSSDSTNFKIALKELKTAMPKMETCFVKLPDLNEISSEEISTPNIKKQIKEYDLLLSKGDNKIKVKTESLSNISSDVDNDCNLQIDINSLKDVSVLDNFEMDRSTVIKVESSDESQSTIEILPASPDGPDELESHIIEDGDSEQLYSADAIPTQFELELEIADHSNTDLLDVATSKFDLVTNCSLHRVPSEECSNQISQTECCNKSELSSCSKNLFGRNKFAKINISDKPSPNNNNLINSAREISSKYICSEVADSTAKNFCCNDSLIKEVLAAKETLKKCLSKSKCENDSTKNNIRPKTVAEKKQGSSFDLKDPSETYSKSNDVLQGCYNDSTSQKVSASPIGNKTETVSNTEKSDQKHSKQNKDCFMKEKLNEKKDKEFYPEEITKDAHECTTSLATFKQLSQATLNESPTRTIYLSEKRKHSMDQDNNILQLQDSHRKELSSYKIPKILKSMDQGSNATKTKDDKLKADNMPILEPEIALNFDANSDRDNSRSPPVITSQDSEDLNIESKLINEKIITLDDKVENDINVCKKSEISITDFITQLACHEKATIKHRRYCNLCERWFPTTSRHRRHLAGYQHRHIELTQRRSIHALFMLFTGKPCPRLLPANVVRNDCSVGELTPLQIAVQDVIKSFDRAQQSPKKPNEVGK